MAVPEPPAPGLGLYYLVMYVKGETWSPEATEEVMATQTRHLAYNAEMAEKGVYKLVGPFEAPHDPRWRGLLLVKADSPEQACEIVDGDPAVQSGRLAYEISSIWLATESVER